jgi:16S rRNA (guanine(966)-N(2))-methyltransferase RsmD
VISGTHGGRRLQAPAGQRTRPTSDRVREALFSILGEIVQGARVLDLFAGSGALGIEAISRGAAAATFVEREERALKALRANLSGLAIEASVVRDDVPRWLRRGESTYSLAFLDPPYAEAETLAPAINAALPGRLEPGATVVVESDRRHPLLLDLPLHDERRYGDTLIRIHGA